MTGVLQVVVLFALALVVPGVVVRTKSWWAGRQGPPILQLGWDLRRLLRKTPVYSEITSPFFRLAPWGVLASTAASAVVVPVFGLPSAFAFPLDFVWFAYAAGLARVLQVVAALDTGSPFEGMGASRDASFSTLVEPTLFLALGGGLLVSGADTLSGVLLHRPDGIASLVVWAGLCGALVIVVLVESARIPVDDPTTHLELTMIHEVTILDHSGPDLAALELASALKLATGLAMWTALFVPVGVPGWVAVPLQLLGVVASAVALGTVESLVARLRMRAVPSFVLVGFSSASLCLIATLWVHR